MDLQQILKPSYSANNNYQSNWSIYIITYLGICGRDPKTLSQKPSSVRKYLGQVKKCLHGINHESMLRCYCREKLKKNAFLTPTLQSKAKMSLSIFLCMIAKSKKTPNYRSELHSFELFSISEISQNFCWILRLLHQRQSYKMIPKYISNSLNFIRGWLTYLAHKIKFWKNRKLL